MAESVGHLTESSTAPLVMKLLLLKPNGEPGRLDGEMTWDVVPTAAELTTTIDADKLGASFVQVPGAFGAYSVSAFGDADLGEGVRQIRIAATVVVTEDEVEVIGVQFSGGAEPTPTPT
jgi:hypothetical protein